MKNVLMILMLAGIAGCVNVDYTGRKFPEQESVRFVRSKSEVDLDRYTLIGRFTADSKTNSHPYYVEEAVMEKARKYGGDILCPNGVAVVRRGVYTPVEQEFGAPKTRENKADPRFGKPEALTGSPWSAYRREFYYLLYKKSSEVDRLTGR